MATQNIGHASPTRRRRNARNRVQLGDYWLSWRAARETWCICYNDARANTRRTISLAIHDYNGGHPPRAAEEALATHFAHRGQAGAQNGGGDAGSGMMGTAIIPMMNGWFAQEAIRHARAETWGYALRNLKRFFEREAASSRREVVVDTIGPQMMKRFITMRKAEGVKGVTIDNELGALRRALTWGWENKAIPAVPFIGRIAKEDRPQPKSVEFDMEQVAALLEAARRARSRWHVHLFTMISLSTHGRTEAILELQSDQLREGRIHFNAEGRRQTSKQRAIVPIVPSLAPWLDDADGKVIRYRNEQGQTRDTWSIKTAFATCQREAGLIRPDGKPLGSPNTLRHTVHTWLQTVGVPQAQIDAAAGHSTERGSGRNYTHLRPEYLKDFIAAIEEYWHQMDKLTTVHRRSQDGAKIYSIANSKKQTGGINQ